MARCVILLGGSFDPVHNGHVALAAHFARLLQPDELRIIPAGNPWQKDGLTASAEHRIEMLRRAFAAKGIPITLDRQEIDRKGASYTLDTLRALRAELGPVASIVFLLGADQLRQLDTWHDWQHLFELAHFCAAGRPGYALDTSSLPQEVAQEFSRRSGTLEQIRATPFGLTYVEPDLAVDASATSVRASLRHGERPASQMPSVVLDYIQQFQLYKD